MVAVSTAYLGHSVKHPEAESLVIYGYIFVNVYTKEPVVRFVLDLSLMMIIILCLAHPGPRLNPVLDVNSVSGISLNLL